MVGIRKIGINTKVFGDGGGGAAYPAILDDGNTVAWFDMAEDNMTKDGSDLVSQWSDRSGLNHHLLQAGADAIKPVWSANGVLFDGTSDSMKAVAFTLEQPTIVYMVFKHITWINGRRIFDGNTSASGAFRQTGSTPQVGLYAGAATSTNNNLALNTYGIARTLFNGASSKITINDTTPTTGDCGSADMGGFTLGRVGGSAALWSNIEVKEIIVRKVADSAPNEAAIYAYLADKYSI